MWVGFLVAQLYLLARVVLKLQFIASQTALSRRVSPTPRSRPARSGPTRPRLRRSRASVQRRFDRA